MNTAAATLTRSFEESAVSEEAAMKPAAKAAAKKKPAKANAPRP